MALKQFYRFKKPVLLVLTGLLFSGLLMAQKTIDGKVFSADDQQPVAGATVTVKSTGVKTTTDQTGLFRISTAENDVLVVSIGGFITKEVGIAEAGSIFLKPDSKNLNEVVVTALGVKKDKKIIGYSSQDVKGSDLVKARESNPINSLVGKVSGLTVGSFCRIIG